MAAPSVTFMLFSLSSFPLHENDKTFLNFSSQLLEQNGERRKGIILQRERRCTFPPLYALHGVKEQRGGECTAVTKLRGSELKWPTTSPATSSFNLRSGRGRGRVWTRRRRDGERISPQDTAPECNIGARGWGNGEGIKTCSYNVSIAWERGLIRCYELKITFYV